MNEIEIYSQPSYSKSIKLYHRSHDSSDRLLNFKFRNKPTDTAILVHNVVNELCVKRFGIPVRSLFFTYMDVERTGSKLRAIPLGDNVRYFYNPKVRDMTVDFVEATLTDDLIDFFFDVSVEFEINADPHVLYDSYYKAINKTQSIHDAIVMLEGDISPYFEDDRGREFTEVVLGKFVKLIRGYVNGLIEVTNIEKLPEGTDAEIMIYAPEDIYLWKE